MNRNPIAPNDVAREAIANREQCPLYWVLGVKEPTFQAKQQPSDAITPRLADPKTLSQFGWRARILCMVLVFFSGSLIIAITAAPLAKAGPDDQWAWIGPYQDTWTCEQDREYGWPPSLASQACLLFSDGAYFYGEWPN